MNIQDIFQTKPNVNLKFDENDTAMKIFHDAFSILIDFVEIQKAEEYRLLNDMPSELKWWKPWAWRDGGLGMRRLMSQSEPLDEHTVTSQTAIEIMDLYNWYTAIRTLRPEPNSTIDLEDDTAEDDFEKVEQLRKTYDTKDQEMIERLIKIRLNLWS